jgi:hypothetical protein
MPKLKTALNCVHCLLYQTQIPLFGQNSECYCRGVEVQTLNVFYLLCENLTTKLLDKKIEENNIIFFTEKIIEVFYFLTNFFIELLLIIFNYSFDFYIIPHYNFTLLLHEHVSGQSTLIFFQGVIVNYA